MRLSRCRRDGGGRQPSLSEGDESIVIVNYNKRGRGDGKLRPAPIDDRPVDEPPQITAREVRLGGKPPELSVRDARRGSNTHYK
jgi:hypothetical protein